MKKTINISGKILSLKTPLIIGIMNTTPDSYYKDSRFSATDKRFLEKATEMIANGVNIIDIGGYSTRPGADHIEVKEELKRVIPAIKILRKEFPFLTISIDTFRSEIAKTAILEGADIINDISGYSLDEKMLETILELNVPYILMHIRGNPQNMQSNTEYVNLVPEVIQELYKKANFLKNHGLKDIILDPGFGFAKSLEQNYELLKNLENFNLFNYPLLIGLSRKSMIYKHLKISPEDSLTATSQLNLVGLLKLSSIIRVHDITEAKHTVKLLEML